MSIKELFTTWDELINYSTANTTKLIVIKCGAHWCAPCKEIKPFFDYLSENYPNVDFFELDITDETRDSITSHLEIAKVPTFIFMKNGVVCQSIIYVNKDKDRIENILIEQL
jgi:thioredoxin 1